MTDRRAAHESTIVCSGCGAEATGIYPFRCPRATGSDDVDHVLTRVLNPEWTRFPADSDRNPFVRYRGLLHSYHVARAHGMPEDAYVSLVRTLDEAIARVDGHGFSETPFERDAALSRHLGFGERGGVWVKDETGNVSGSHKGRHLAGIMIYLQVLERVGLVAPPLPPLAIASCGNAALAAAVVARAADRDLHVFIPPDAPPSVVGRLRELGACLTMCERTAGSSGDPCYHAFRRAVAGGALPFCCQGSENGLTIEGGETLGYEMVSALAGIPLDRIVIQVGGGALASACIQAFREAVELGALPASPRIDTVQTAGAWPLKRAFDAIAASGDPMQALRFATRHRSAFMWPWEDEPRSVAHGILDDETYDWRAVVEGMLATGGRPLVVDEGLLARANALARRSTGIDVDHTGSAGLAGLLALRSAGEVSDDERVAVLFTGVVRTAPTRRRRRDEELPRTRHPVAQGLRAR